ncbi:hypothetical protein BDB01DRAFT_831783 [Pilobolus umbonatus]|nr:hypothetical protein BDB01DRAFT_831783 [Pilobolus umbonatus]
MVYQGIASIKRNPSGGLLEQIIGGKYVLPFGNAVYLDIQKSKVLDFFDLSAIIYKPTVVTEDMGETGRFSSYYYKGENIELIKWNRGLREVIFRFGTGAEENAFMYLANNDTFHMRGNLTLSPYV